MNVDSEVANEGIALSEEEILPHVEKLPHLVPPESVSSTLIHTNGLRISFTHRAKFQYASVVERGTWKATHARVRREEVHYRGGPKEPKWGNRIVGRAADNINGPSRRGAERLDFLRMPSGSA